MDKKEYIIRQLGRTKNKKYELYVVTRIIHLLNMDEVKFVTQQYVARPEGRALTDLFFPQIHLHIEVDEEFHKDNEMSDMAREADIINATGHVLERVNAGVIKEGPAKGVKVTIEEINKRVDEIVEIARGLVKQKRDRGDFEEWDIEGEFKSETYVKKGYIDVDENVAFRTIKDACNCFGHQYQGYQKAGAKHPDPKVMLWFPKLYPNGEWSNTISDDESTIFEKNEDLEKAKQYEKFHLHSSDNVNRKRIVFARVIGSLGDVLYRFKGQYELNLEKSGNEKGLVWDRTKKRVDTYSPGFFS